METFMKANNLRWVFCVLRGNVSYYLADENNNPLGYPFLRNLSKDERKLLDGLGICCSTDPASFIYFDVFPKEPREMVEITADAYIEVRKGKDVEFYKAGTYTDTWTNPMDYQFVNKTVLANIPQYKIHIAGHYVPVSE